MSLRLRLIGWSPWILAAAIVALPGQAVAAPQDQEPAAEEAAVSEGGSWASSSDAIRAGILDSFSVDAESDGVVLRPRSGSLGIREIEIVGNSVRVDGDYQSPEELAAMLPESAEWIVALSALSREEQAALFDEEPRRRESRSSRSEHRRKRSDAQVSIGSGVYVAADEIARDVVSVGGRVEVDGEVVGSAVAIGGPAVVRGKVNGDLVCIGNRIYLEETAVVLGDVVSVGSTMKREPGAQVMGEVTQVALGSLFGLGSLGAFDDYDDWEFGFHEPSPVRRFFGFVWRLIGLTIIGLIACLAYLLAQRPTERMARKVSTAPWQSALVGIASVLLFVPVLVVVVLVLAISIIGIPLLILVPFAILGLVLLAFVGFTSVAYQLGRWLDRRFGWAPSSPYAQILIGLGAIYLFSLLGHLLQVVGGPLHLLGLLVISVGGAIKAAAGIVGFGAVILTRFGTLDDPSAAAGGPPAPPSPPHGEQASYEAEPVSEPPVAEEPNEA